MALDPIVNFFRSTIATLPVASGGTSIVLQTGDGNKLPAPAIDGAFNLTIYNADDPFVAPEIVRVTARSGDTLTVTRAQEGTSATNKTSGSTWNVELTPTAKTIQDIDTNKVNVADIVDDLTSTDTDKPLSANQGKVLQDGKLNLSGGTMTGDLTIPDKIIHSGDTNTAIRFPANDTVSIETGGSERIRVANGVSIGSTADAGIGNLFIGGVLHTKATQASLVSDTATDFVSIEFTSAQVSCYTKLKYQLYRNNSGALTHDAGELLIVWRSNTNSPALASTNTRVGGITPTFTFTKDTGNNKLTIACNPGIFTSSNFTYALEVLGQNITVPPIVTHL